MLQRCFEKGGQKKAADVFDLCKEQQSHVWPSQSIPSQKDRSFENKSENVKQAGNICVVQFASFLLHHEI